MKYLDCLVKYSVSLDHPVWDYSPLFSAIRNLRHEDPKVRAEAPKWIGEHFRGAGMPHSADFFATAGQATHDLAGLPQGVDSKVSVDTDVPGEPRVWLTHRDRPGSKMAVATYRDIKSPDELHKVLSGFAEEGHVNPEHIAKHIDAAFPSEPRFRTKEQKAEVDSTKTHANVFRS